MIKVIFFDFDGTISDAFDVALKNMEKVLKKNGYVVSKSKIKEVLGLKTREMFSAMKIPFYKHHKIRRDLFQFMKKDIKKLKLCCDVKPLEDLKKKGYKMVVVSNSDPSFILKSAEHLKVRRLFDEFYCAEQFKSKDRILKMLLKKYGVKGKSCFYVGDRYTDIIYSRKVGVKSVAIHNKCSWSSLSLIKKEKPDFIIKNFKQLRDLVEKLDIEKY